MILLMAAAVALEAAGLALALCALYPRRRRQKPQEPAAREREEKKDPLDEGFANIMSYRANGEDGFGG